MKILKFLVVVCSIVLFSSCCPKKKVEKEKEKVAPPEEKVEKVSPEGTKPVEASPSEVKKAIKGEEIPQEQTIEGKNFVSPDKILSSEEASVFENIYFDFDKYNLKPPAQATLKKIGSYLLKNPKISLLIEGHCDERGTREYNLVLGEKRALSAREFLIALGVSPKRIFTVSYGEDRPVDPRSNEEAWAKNRRDEFKISMD